MTAHNVEINTVGEPPAPPQKKNTSASEIFHVWLWEYHEKMERKNARDRTQGSIL